MFSERAGGEGRRQPLDANRVPAVPGLPPLPAVRGLTAPCLWGMEGLHQKGQWSGQVMSPDLHQEGQWSGRLAIKKGNGQVRSGHLTFIKEVSGQVA